MRQILDPSRGILVIDHERRIRSVNRAFEDALGSPAGISIGKCLGDALLCSYALKSPTGCGKSPECLPCNAREIALAALTRGETSRSLARISLLAGGHKDEVQLTMSAGPLEVNGQKLAALIVEDLSPLRDLRRGDTCESFHGIVGRDPQMLYLLDVVRQAGPIDVPVLIQGESGTGKEMVARALHLESSRRNRPLVTVNVGALAGGLFESELFGHVKGSFTGAIRNKPGRFEMADGGTLFLDEIGELSPEVQVKLLRVLQNGTFDRVGGEQPVRVDVRVICATSRDLEEEVEAGRFRQDLFYRLCVVLVSLPPLRQRFGDLPILAEHLLSLASRDFDLPAPRLMPSALAAMAAHTWPGNVRELDNAIRHALIKSGGRPIDSEHLPSSVGPGVPVLQDFMIRSRLDLTPETIKAAVRAAQGNKAEAARRLGVSRATLYRHLGRQEKRNLS